MATSNISYDALLRRRKFAPIYLVPCFLSLSLFSRFPHDNPGTLMLVSANLFLFSLLD